MERVIRHKGSTIPLVGLGSTQFWYGNRGAEEALAEAIEEGQIALVDCAEMYGNGRCEDAVGRVLKRTGRDRVFLVDKILPQNAVPGRFERSLETSLRRLHTDHFDLYLLHWREDADLAYVAAAMHEAVRRGLVLRWGVSNFDLSDMEDLFACPYGEECFCDQIMYNIGTRGIEYDLLPWLREKGVLPMSYSSLGSSAGFTDIRKRAEGSRVLRALSRDTGLSIPALMLSFVVRDKDICALFNSSSIRHIRENLRGTDFDIHPYLPDLARDFPAPDHRVPLAKL